MATPKGAWDNSWGDLTVTATETCYEPPLEWTGLFDAEGEPIFKAPPPVGFLAEAIEAVKRNIKATANDQRDP